MWANRPRIRPAAAFRLSIWAALVLCGPLRRGARHPRSTAILSPGVLGLDALIAHGLLRYLLSVRSTKKKTESIERPPSAKVMDEAIDLAIKRRSPYPDRAAFIDADTASAGHEIKRAADEGLPVVLVADDGSTRVLMPEAATR